MNGKMIVKQAVKLYQMGLHAERERKRLNEYVERFGPSSPQCVNQALKVEGLLDEFTTLEKQHLILVKRIKRERLVIKPTRQIKPSKKRWNT